MKKKEIKGSQLLLTREEWLKRSGKGNTSDGGDYRRRENRVARDRSQVKCFSCGGYGHYAAECRKSGRNRQQKGEANLTQLYDNEPALLMASFLNNVEGEIACSEEQTWYLDNGASNHMTGRRDKFEKLDMTARGKVKFGDGSLVEIEGKGSIRIACKTGETRVLSNVYFIPTLRSNIISLGQLSEEGNRVVIDGEHLWVYERSGRLLLRVRRSSNRLYKIQIEEAQ